MANVYQSVLGSGGAAPTSITPSNSAPASMSSGGVYQPTANGYAIESYTSKTPSDSTPPSVASGDIVKMGGAGYLYATQQDSAYEVLTGSKTGSSGLEFTVTSQKSKAPIFAVLWRDSEISSSSGRKQTAWVSPAAYHQYIYGTSGGVNSNGASGVNIATVQSVDSNSITLRLPTNNYSGTWKYYVAFA